MVMKGEPWYPIALLNTSHIAEMQSWGFNAIRLGVMWSGVEPQKGYFNETYIKIISEILDNLEAHGIAAIIDVHQDVMSSYFCLYDGFPSWVVDLSNASAAHPFPWPLEGDCGSRSWSSNYFAEATGAAFQDLYDNRNGIRDLFSIFWVKIANAFKSKNILGYEVRLFYIS
jgi:endoglycosylceramidase